MDKTSDDIFEVKDYNSYLKFCSIESVSPCSEAEFNTFYGPQSRFIAAGNPFVTGLGNFVLKNREKFLMSASQGPTQLRDTIIASVLDDGLKSMKDFKIGKGSGESGGGSTSSGGSGKGGDAPAPSNTLMGSFETRPISVELRPGIQNRTYSSSFQLPDQNYATTHLTGLSLNIPDDAQSQYYFDNVVVPYLQTRAQQSVSFRVDLSTISASRVRNYLNNILSALSLYYFCTSLLSYVELPSNRDQGIKALRSMLSISDLDYLNQLRQLLQSLPIPPNLNTLAFFIYQTFTDSEFGDGIFKFMPTGFNTTPNNDRSVFSFTGVNSDKITNMINDLNSYENRELASVFMRIAPSWVQPKVFDPSPVPMYSKLACTIFANSAHNYFNGTNQIRGPFVSSLESKTNYLSYDNNLDGVALALCTRYIGTETSTTQPTLVKIANTAFNVGGTFYVTNRLSYVYSSSGNNYIWRPSNISIESAFGRMERSRAHLGTEYYARLPGSIRVDNVTPNIMAENVKDTLNWMMSFDTIKGKQSSYRGGSKSKNKPKDKEGVKEES